MILGVRLELANLLYGGTAVMLVLVFQMLVGKRIIKFKGRTHQKVHRWAAWVLTAMAAIHGLLAVVYYNHWEILS